MFGAIMAATTLAAGAYSAYEQREAGKAQQAMANAQAKQEYENALRDSERAGLAQEEASREAQRRMDMLSQDLGTLYTTAAGNGVLLNSGSVASLTKGNITEARADASSILEQGNLNVRAYNDSASARAAQSSLLTFSGAQAKKAANRSSFGTLLSSAGSAVSSGMSGYKLGTAINTRYGTNSIFSDPLLK